MLTRTEKKATGQGKTTMKSQTARVCVCGGGGLNIAGRRHSLISAFIFECSYNVMHSIRKLHQGIIMYRKV